MGFYLALLLSAAHAPPPQKVEAMATARIMILRPHRASPETWDPATKRHQKEIVRKERDGSSVRLRLTEFE